MKFYSTNNRSNLVSFKEAVIKGIANDGGLFLPVEFPKLQKEFFEKIHQFSFPEISLLIANEFLKDEINFNNLEKIIYDSINFPAPLVNIAQNEFVLELFHGPTLAFKDFGARFMAKILEHINKNENKEITILVATSGDTGSAVANGFYNTEGIKVVLLFPSKKVSEIQEKQLTTLGGNVIALEVEGNFDDCQRLVKQAFADVQLNSKLNLSSANSINIARLLPQSFYYFNAFAQIENKKRKLIFSIPSGNLGNLTAGIFAYKMGLPVHKFIAAVNANDVFTQYLSSGKFNPKDSIQTLSNAMDVGNPSNFARIISIFENDHNKIQKIISSSSHSDEETLNAIKQVHQKYNYVFDPHGAVGFLALQKYLKENPGDYNSIILETAHPAKFLETVEKAIDSKIEIPERLKICLNKEKISIKISNKFEKFKEFLMK